MIDYIEVSIKKDIKLDTVASYSGISKFHLNRLFKALTGKTLMGYVLQRKLAHSLQDLLETNLNIIDIAYEYGFSYEQSYTRAFTRHFKQSPNRVRKERPFIDITEKIQADSLIVMDNTGVLTDPLFRIKPESLLFGQCYDIEYDEYGQNREMADHVSAFYRTIVPRIGAVRNEHHLIGYVDNNPDKKNHARYTTAVEVSHDRDIPVIPDGRLIHLATQRYAVFTYIGLHPPIEITSSRLRDIYNHAFRTWLPRSSYIQAQPYHMERIDLSVSGTAYCELELHIPISTG